MAVKKKNANQGKVYLAIKARHDILIVLKVIKPHELNNYMKKGITLQEVATQYNCTLSRACTEILAAAGVEKRHMTCVIRKQKISPELVKKAQDYRSRTKLIGLSIK